MKTKKITPSEYAELKKMTLSGVTKAIRQGRKLDGIAKIEKFGRFYLLTLKNGYEELS